MDWKTNKADYFLEAAKKPENRVFFARIASRLLELGRPEEAAALCSENIGRRADYLSGLLVLGESYLALGNYEKAKEMFNAALKQDPDNLRALFLLGRGLRLWTRCCGSRPACGRHSRLAWPRAA